MSVLGTMRSWFGAKAAAAAPSSANNGSSGQAKSLALKDIVNPEAKDRWIAADVKCFTPERIERTLRGAMTGNLVAQWELYDLMEATWPRLQKNLNQLKGKVQGLDWSVQPWAPKGEEPTAEAQRRAQLLEEAIWNMTPLADRDENDFELTIGDIMDAWGKGLSVLELHWDVRRYETGMIFAPRATTWVHPRHYGYPQDDYRLMLNTRESGFAGRSATGATSNNQSIAGRSATGATSATGTTGNSDWLEFPANKFLICQAKQKSGPPIGAALLRPLAFWWSAVNFTSEWFLNFCQIFGMPIRWATYDPNATPKATIDLIADMLTNMGSAAWAMFPAGTQLELKEASKGIGDNPHRGLIEFADKLCDILILWQTLTTDATDRGTQALGTVHQDVLSDVEKKAANFVARVLNRQLVPAFCLLNFGDLRECPYLLPGIEEPKDAKSMAERDQILLNAGAELPRDWFYERHDIPIPAPGEEVIAGTSVPANAGTSVPANGGAAAPPYQVQAKDATDQLIDNVLEDLTGIEAKWLGGVKPVFAELVAKAKDGDVSDAEFVAALERARREMPELFERMDADALADALEGAMGAACANGVARGFQKRSRRPMRLRRKTTEAAT